MKRRYIFLLGAVLLAAVVFFYRTNPLRHAQTFVSMYSDHIENSIRAQEGIPDNLGCLDVNEWDGAHFMVEFTLSGWGIGSGTRYYGCYYSPDGVPLPFQNSGEALTQDGHDYWVWNDGGNHGATQKIKDNWYYFEASF